jgi:hypothetical protein
MTSSTFATCIIEADDQEAAQADFPGHFTAPFSETGQAPATHYVDSGFWFDAELTKLVNETAWPRQVFFGDAQAAIDSLGLKPVVETPEIEE